MSEIPLLLQKNKLLSSSLIYGEEIFDEGIVTNSPSTTITFIINGVSVISDGSDVSIGLPKIEWNSQPSGKYKMVVTKTTVSGTANTTLTIGDTAIELEEGVKETIKFTHEQYDNIKISFDGTEVFEAIIEISLKGASLIQSSLPEVVFENVVSTNAATYLTTPTYDGSNQVVHPSVYYNADGWNGYKYWMAMTPYPSSNADYENPSIIVSNDGDTWVVPDGVTNPLETPVTGHYSDCDIFMNTDNLLYIMFRWTDNTDDIIYVINSSNGVTWSEKQSIMTFSVATEQCLSPSMVIENGLYKVYFVDWVGVDGKLKYKSCSTITGTWSDSVLCSITGMPADRYAWHLSIHKYGNKYHSFLQTTDATVTYGKLHFATSDNGTDWTIDSIPFLDNSISGWDKAQIYRSFGILKNDGAYYYDLFYSAKNSSNQWRVGRTSVQLDYVAASVASLKPNIMSLYEFNEVSGTTMNDALGVYNGTITGDVTVNQTGILDKAYLFGGVSNNINLGDLDWFEYNQPFTISAWLKAPNGTGVLTILSKINTASPYTGISFHYSAYKLQLQLINTWNVNYLSTLTDLTFNYSGWAHVIVTYDGSGGAGGINYYVNNVLMTKTSVGTLSASIQNNFNLNIGSRGDANYYYKGYMDQLIILNTVVTEEQRFYLINKKRGVEYINFN